MLWCDVRVCPPSNGHAEYVSFLNCSCFFFFPRSLSPQLPASLQAKKKKPQGIILVHGAMAHAHWWDHVAPHLASSASGLAFDVAALSNTGHGESDWREKYTADVYAREIVAVCRDAGFFDTDREALPVIIGHSLGTYFSERAVQLHPNLFSGLIIADGGVPHPVVWSSLSQDQPPPWTRPKGVKHRVYPPTTTPEERLRLSPPQPVLHSYVVDHIARTSIKATSPQGHWCWAVDPDHSNKIDSFIGLAHTIGSPEVVRSLPVKVAVLVGAESAIIDSMYACRLRDSVFLSCFCFCFVLFFGGNLKDSGC